MNYQSELATPEELNPSNNEDSQQVYTETDEAFIQEVKDIYQKKCSTMKSFFEESDINQEKCEQIAEYADLHSRANIFNSNSVLNFRAIKNQSIEYCPCGCKRGTGEQLPLLTNEQKLTFLGPGVILFFYFLRHVKTSLIFMLTSFGFFAIMSNLLSPKTIEFGNCYTKSNEFQEYVCYLNIIMTFNLKTSTSLKLLQLWLGAFVAICWFLGIKLIQYLGKKKNEEVDDLLDSASDYTIRIQNLPFGQVTEYQVIEYLEKLWKNREESEDIITNESLKNSTTFSDSLNLRSVQIIYNMSECRGILSRIQQIGVKLHNMLENENKICGSVNIMNYHLKKQEFLDRFEEIEQFREKFKTDENFRRELSTTCALVYFHQSKMQSQFVKYFEKKRKINPLVAICQKEKKYFYRNNQIIFTRAPEPSDFHWPNCEIKFSYVRYFFIWVITIVILYSAYAFVSYIQTIDEVKQSAHIVISVVIQVFNRIIWYSLSFLVIFEYHNTKTDEIVSLMRKSIFAQVMNVIVAPMIGKFLNNKPIYGENSVSLSALFYQFVMFFMMVIFYVINPYYYLKLLIINIRCIRDKMIRKITQVVGEIDTIEEIRPVYAFYEGPPFPMAGAYVYMATAIIHALFYCHLQPLILFVVILNISGFYLIMKYLLFRRCKIPQLTDVQIFEIGIGSISYGTFFYGAGSLMFIILEEYDKDTLQQVRWMEVVPSCVCLLIWILLNINPFEISDKIVMKIYNSMKFSREFMSAHESQSGVKKQYQFKIISSLITKAMEGLDKKEPVIFQRKESYYKHANAHKLFNFESEIKEMANEQSVKRTHELQQFCESFCNKENIQIEQIGEAKKVKYARPTYRNSVIEEGLAEMILIPAVHLKRETKIKKSQKENTANLILRTIFRNQQRNEIESAISEKPQAFESGVSEKPSAFRSGALEQPSEFGQRVAESPTVIFEENIKKVFNPSID